MLLTCLCFSDQLGIDKSFTVEECKPYSGRALKISGKSGSSPHFSAKKTRFITKTKIYMTPKFGPLPTVY